MSAKEALSRVAGLVLLALLFFGTLEARGDIDIPPLATPPLFETITTKTAQELLTGRVDGAKEDWWQVDLNAVHPISEVKVYSEPGESSCLGAASLCYVFISKQPFSREATVATLLNQPGLWADHQLHTAGLPMQLATRGNVVGRYVRLQFQDPNRSVISKVEINRPKIPRIYIAGAVWTGERASTPWTSMAGQPFVLGPPSPLQAKEEETEYDKIVRYYNWTNLYIYYAPGTYLTYGAVWNHTGPGGTVLQIPTAYRGVRHIGAGRDATIIRLQGTLRGEMNNGSAVHEEYKYIFDNAGLGDSDGFELHDLTLDCNGRRLIDALETNYPRARANVGGVRTTGTGIAYVNVKVIGFGCTSGPGNRRWPAKGGTPGPECFPLVIYNQQANRPIHARIEGCVVTEPGTSPDYSDGVTAISLYVPPQWDANCYVSNCIVKDVATPKKNDRVTPAFLYTHGFAGNRCLNSSFINSGVGGAVYYEIDEGFDFEHGDFLVQGNTFVDCPSGVKIHWVSRKNRDGNWKPSVLGRLSVIGNKFFLNPAGTAHAMWCFDDHHGTSGSKVNDLDIRHNVVTYRGDGPGYSGGGCVEKFYQRGPLHQGFVLARFAQLNCVSNQFYLGFKRANPSRSNPGEPANNEILIDQSDRGRSVFRSASFVGNYNHCQAAPVKLYSAESPYPVRYYRDSLWDWDPGRRTPVPLGTQLTAPW